MPRYGNKRRSRRKSNFRRSRRSAIRRKTGPSVTVKKRVKIARRSTVMRNRSLISKIRNKMRGPIQCNLVDWTTPVLRITERTPLLFSLDDFTHRDVTPTAVNGAPVYQVDPVSGNVQQVSYWKIVDNTSLNPYMERWQTDNVGGGSYHMIMNKILLEVTSRSGLNNVRVRVQMFSMKTSALIRTTSAASLMQMPDGLIHLDGMANFSANPNLLPRKFFKTYYDRTIMINSEPASSSGVHPTTANKKYIPVTVKPRGGKTVTQAVTFPPVQDTDPNPALGEPSGGWFGVNNRPQGQILFLLVSTDYPYVPTVPPTPSPVEVSCSSYRKWRDPVGSYY